MNLLKPNYPTPRLMSNLRRFVTHAWPISNALQFNWNAGPTSLVMLGRSGTPQPVPHYTTYGFGYGNHNTNAAEGMANNSIGTFNARPFWMATSWMQRTMPSAATRYSAALGINSGASTVRFAIGVNATGDIVGEISNVTGTVITITGPSAVRGSLYHVSLITRGQTDHSMWVNGVRYDSVADTTAATLGSYNRFCLGAWQKDVLVSSNHSTFFHGCFGTRDPGDFLLQALSDDPWQFYYPPLVEPAKTLWYVPAAAGGGAFAPYYWHQHIAGGMHGASA